MVKLEETKDRRRLHIGSYFVDLNETDYEELVRIFSDENRVKNLSIYPPVIGSSHSPKSELDALLIEGIKTMGETIKLLKANLR